MNNVLLDIIDEIMDKLEENNYEAYTYTKKKFHIVDKNENIDFQAKLGNNNYYFKDNISGLSVIKTKKYIDDNTTIQQLLIEEDNEKCFYSYLERNGYVNLVRAIRVEGNDSLVCNNFNVLNHPWEEIKEYADSCFEDTNDMEDVQPVEFTPDDEFLTKIAEQEDDSIKKEFYFDADENEEDNEYYEEDNEYEDVFEDDDEEEYDDEYESEQLEENEKYGLSDLFENNTIHDYETYITRKQECEENGEKYNQKEDNLPIGNFSEAIEDYYSDYQLIINGREIDGQAKCRIIGDCEAAVDEKAFDSVDFDQAAINLMAVLTATQKESNTKKNDDYEK